MLKEIYDQIENSTTDRSKGFSLHYALLYSLVLGLESKNVFEFGTGYSTEVILRALEKTGGKLISCDKRNKKQRSISDYTRDNPNWSFYRGHSNLIFNDIEHQQYDLILHDGSHRGSEVLIDLNNIYPYLKHDGILIIHDTRHSVFGSKMMSAILKFIKNKDMEICTLPYGSGLTFFRNNGNIENKVELTWRKNTHMGRRRRRRG